MISHLHTVLAILFGLGLYYIRFGSYFLDELMPNANNHSSKMMKIQNPSLVSKFGQYFTEDGGITYENPNHKPRKFYPEDFENYFHVRLVNRLIDDDSIKALVDAHDIYRDEKYLNDKEVYDSLAAEYGLYIDNAVANDRRFYVAYAGHDKHYGVFADVDIPKGSFIGPYAGMLTNNTSNNDYSWEYLSADVKDETGTNLELVVDGRIYGNILRFVNHDDEPNVKAYQIPWGNRWHGIYVAIRDIHEGDELLVSYGSHYWEKRQGKV